MVFLVATTSLHCQQSTARTATPERRPLERRTLVPFLTDFGNSTLCWNTTELAFGPVAKRFLDKILVGRIFFHILILDCLGCSLLILEAIYRGDPDIAILLGPGGSERFLLKSLQVLKNKAASCHWARVAHAKEETSQAVFSVKQLIFFQSVGRVWT